MKYRLKIALLSAGVLLGYGFGVHHLATGKHCHRRPAAERCAPAAEAAPTPGG